MNKLTGTSTSSEYYIITYEVHVGTIQPGEQKKYSNNATATSTNPNTNERVTASDREYASFSNNVLNKTGSFDSVSQTITWTITVNADKNNITGYVLEDKMFTEAIAGSLSVEPQKGYTINEAGNTITFNALDNNNTNTQTYTITYTTSSKQTSQNNSVVNDVTLTPPDSNDPITDSSSVWIPAGGGLNKQFTDVDKSKGIISWSTTVTVPPAGFKTGTVIQDNMGSTTYNTTTNHWLTAAQLTDLYNSLLNTLPADSFKLEYTTNIYGTWKEYSSSISDSDTAYSFRITFLKDITPTQDNETVSEFTYNYSTTANFNNVVDYESYQNLTWMGDYKSLADYTYHSHVAKLDSFGNASDSAHTNDDGFVGWYVKVFTTEDVSTLSILDTLPEGVTLTKIGVALDSRSNAYNAATDWSSTVTGSLPINDSVTCSVTSTSADSGIQTTISAENDTKIPARTTIYIYYECQINSDEMPSSGETKTFHLKNNVTVKADDAGYGDANQAQDITVSIPDYITKTDGSGNEGDTNIISSDGIVSWFVQTYQTSGNSVTITDKLPAGVSLVKIGVGASSYDARQNAATLSGSVTVGNWNVSHALTEADSGDTIVTTVNFGSELTDGTSVYVYYECLIDNYATLDGGYTVQLRNEASVTINGTSYTASQTQTVTKPDDIARVVDKSASWDSGKKQIAYTVLINEGAEDLDSDSDTLTVIDVMKHYRNQSWSVNSKLVNSSVKLYYAVTADDGTLIKGDEVPVYLWSWVFSDNVTPELLAGQGDVINTITATVPDGIALFLEYTYDISIPDTQASDWSQVWIQNDVTVYGDTKSSDQEAGNNNWKVTGTSAGIETNHVYNFTKVEQGNYAKTISNAVFGVYIYNENGTDDRLKDSNGNPVSYTTDSNGTFTVKWEDGYYSEDVVYYVRELSAPDGYIVDTTTRYYFYFGSSDSSVTLDVPEGARDLNSAYGVAYVENKPSTTDVSVRKVWDSSVSESARTDITVQLYQKFNSIQETELFSGTASSSSSWGWPIQVNTTNTTGTFDPALITEGSYFSVYYTGTSGQVRFAFKTDDTSSGWYQLETPSKTEWDGTNQCYVSTFSYADIAAIFDVRSLSSIKAIFTGNASSTDITITKFTWTPGSGSASRSTDVKYKDPVTLNAGSNWAGAWTNLPLYQYADDGTLEGYYSYYVRETTTGFITTYSQSGNTWTITNTKEETTEETTSVTVNKVWSGVDTPISGSITFMICQNGTDYREVTLDYATNNSWSITVDNLPTKDSDSNAYTYTVKETKVNGTAIDNTGYTSTVTGDAASGFTITNTKTTEETTSITVKKEWDDGNSATRPTSISFYLLQDGIRYGDVHTLTSDSWSATISGLPVGHTYTVEEVAVDGYTTSYSNNGISSGTITITNTKDQTTDNKTSITVKKEWADGTTAGNSVQMQLYQLLTETNPEDYTTVPLFTGSYEILDSNNNGQGWDVGPVIPTSILDGPMDPYVMTSGGYFSVYYTGTWGCIYLALQDSTTWGWYQIDTPSSTTDLGNGSYVSTFNYADCVTAYGSSNFLDLDKVIIGSGNATDIIVSSITWTSGTTNTAYQSPVSVTSSNGWTHTWDDLPLYEYDSNGNIIGYYSYYVVEDTNTYTVSYSNGGTPVTEGTITVTNSLDNPSYELPKTGSLGTTPYITAGAAMTLGAALLMYSRKKRGRGSKST